VTDFHYIQYECLFFFGFYASQECDEDLKPLAMSSRWITTREDGGLKEEDRGVWEVETGPLALGNGPATMAHGEGKPLTSCDNLLRA